jgi:vacuolar-type H+-ATPase subunit F/Vma7
MKPQTALAVWILLAGAAMAQAQTGIWMGVGPAPRSAAIKNAPFSADLVSINDHINGQPGIKNELHGNVARNSQGESYFAMELTRPQPDPTRPMRVTITDPAALTVTSLDPQSKTAFVSHITANTLNKAPILTPGNNTPTSDGRPPKPVDATASAANNTKTEALGTKEISGLRVVGVRTIHTNPPNGPNDKPFVSTVDTWTSPELKVIVMTETQTSNGDHHVSRLENIVRTEPNAVLFQIPSGYTVHDNMPMATNIH